MDLRWVAGLGLAGYMTYAMVGGYGVMVGTERYLSQQRAAGCLVGIAGHLPSQLAEECTELFTVPGHVVRPTANDHAIMVGIPITRHDLSKIHHAVSVGAPDRMARVAQFDVWWRGLPNSGS